MTSPAAPAPVDLDVECPLPKGWTDYSDKSWPVTVISMEEARSLRAAAYRAGRLAGLEEAAKLDHDDILDVAAAIRALKDRVHG